MNAADARLRWRFAACSAFLGALALALVFDLGPRIRFDTDLLALLPIAQQDAGVDEALRRVSAAQSGRSAFLVGAADFASAKTGAAAFAATLRNSGAFTVVQHEELGGGKLVHDIYRPFLPALLPQRALEQLRAGDASALLQEARRKVYSPLPMPSALPIAEDPLGLANAFLLQGLPPAGHALPRAGVLTVSHEGTEFVLVLATLAGSAFDSDAQDRALLAIDQAESAARAAAGPGLQLLRAGVLFHATAATREAKREISLISGISLTAITVLVLLTFGSLRPLGLTLLSLAAGTACGFAACGYLFGRLHLLTLVFGSTLIGVAVDYSNYWLHDAFDDFDGWTPQRALHNTGRGIALALLTSVLGYLALTLAPFPGLQQMAVFSAAGLVGAAACVLCLYPVLARRPRRPDPPILGLALLLQGALLQLLRFKYLALLAALLLGAGVLRLQALDDIRLLQSSPAEVLAQETRLRALLGNAPDSRFFLVRGSSAQDVLEREEALAAQLEDAVRRGVLSNYWSTTRALPSLKVQAEMRQRLASEVHAERGPLEAFMQELGFSAEDLARRQQALAAVPADGLALDDWLRSPAAEAFLTLWLDLPGQHASLVMLAGVRDTAALQAIKAPGVVLVDKVRDISTVLGDYRRMALRVLVLAHAIAALLLALRYGLRRSLPLMAGTLGAALLTLGAFGWLGIALNLFNTLALLLVLGIGIDYVIFVQEGTGTRRGPLLGVQLSALTTLLSFGLLAFSATPFLNTLGLTLLMGIGWSFVFALLAAKLPARTS